MKHFLSRAVTYITAHKVLLAAAVAVVGLSFTGLYLYGQGSNNAKAKQASKCPVSYCVALNKDAATPSEISVIAGSYVQFNSADGGTHNLFLAHAAVQHEDASRYESGDFGAAEAWKVQFKQDGAYSFKDKNNEEVEINVVVYTPGKDYKIESSSLEHSDANETDNHSH